MARVMRFVQAIRSAPLLGILAIIALMGGTSAVQATSSYGGTNDWTMVGSPQVTTIVDEGVLVTYQNNLSVPTQGVAILVVRNSMGQAVGFGTATLDINASTNSIAFMAAAGVTSGSYTISIFAVSFGGVALSTTTTASVSF